MIRIQLVPIFSVPLTFIAECTNCKFIDCIASRWGASSLFFPYRITLYYIIITDNNHYHKMEHHVTIERIQNICAIGAGAMGAGTALCFAIAGYAVTLYDINDASLENGMKNMREALAATDIPTILARIQTTTTLETAAQNADFVIESIVEILAVKQNLFATLDKLCPAHTIFATNTSGLSPTAIAESINRKDKFIVTHFWNPPHLIPLVEVVPGQHTSQATVDTAFALMLKIGKKPVALARESLGFVGNRLQVALLREALHIVAEGIASAADVDTVVELTLGRRLAVTGPLKSADLGGLDIFKNIFGYLGADLCNAPHTPALLEQTVAAGHLGAKTGEGFYPWPTDQLAAIRAERVEELFRHLKNDRK
jgi:3-hydroxybutyryl-CoA dehydrogenase